ncbi:hypothetical protein VM94_01441 [Janthinobacterium sp. KBS0711]|nr:hypothetical protein VM94_01441 [Janthinobacterium sp. KBS0711]
MLGRQRQQLADVCPALGIERQADFFGGVAQYEGKEFTGIYQMICHAAVYLYQNAYDKVRRAERGSTGWKCRSFTPSAASPGKRDA